MAAPISYEVNGEQYIAVAVGRGGGLSQVMGIEFEGATPRGRFMAFKLGGTARLPAVQEQTFPEPLGTVSFVDADSVLSAVLPYFVRGTPPGE